MQYNGKKDTLEIFNDTWKANHQGNIPNKMKEQNDISFKVNKPNNSIPRPNNGMNKPIGFNNNRNSGFHG